MEKKTKFSVRGSFSKDSSDWLELVFYFGTESEEEQLNKPPCIKDGKKVQT